MQRMDDMCFAVCNTAGPNNTPQDVDRMFTTRQAAEDNKGPGQVIIPITFREFRQVLDGDLSPILNSRMFPALYV